MPKKASLTQLSEDKVSRMKGMGKIKKYSTKFPKQAKKTAQLKSDLKKWHQSVKAPKAPREYTKKIKAIRLKSKHVAQLRQISESPAATAEVIAQKMTPDDVLNVMYSSLTTYEYYKMQAEYKKRQKDAKSAKDKDKLRQDWEEIVKWGQKSFTAAGLKQVTAKDLDDFSRELKRSNNNFNAVVTISNTGVATPGKKLAATTRATTAISAPTGSFVPQVGAAVDPSVTLAMAAASFCDHPLEGSFTKDISKSFEMKTSLYVWCPTWSAPWRWCWKTFVLAGVSFRVGLDVGYRVSCCGASAWGRAYAEACGTIIGIKVCAGCTASVYGVAGIGRTQSTGGDCSYGLGLTAQLNCVLAGIPVFAFAYSFGYTVTGPCPPPELKC